MWMDTIDLHCILFNLHHFYMHMHLKQQSCIVKEQKIIDWHNMQDKITI